MAAEYERLPRPELPADVEAFLSCQEQRIVNGDGGADELDTTKLVNMIRFVSADRDKLCDRATKLETELVAIKATCIAALEIRQSCDLSALKLVDHVAQNFINYRPKLKPLTDEQVEKVKRALAELAAEDELLAENARRSRSLAKLESLGPWLESERAKLAQCADEADERGDVNRHEHRSILEATSEGLRQAKAQFQVLIGPNQI